MNYTINLDELLAELREQDEIYDRLDERRQQIRNLAKGLGVYDMMWDMLHSDDKAHVSF